MSRINILPSNIYNKIAAGEVVERPASVVKELVENSIDAGARKISIYIKGCGLDSIAVVDDGCGIAREDIDKAFLPHATSKISKADDLTEIKTLGFRGEALASIASVSQLMMWSKVAEEDCGTKISIKGGEIVSKEYCTGETSGTKIIVDQLFYNVPARKKFLKRPSTETSEVTNVVIKLILSNPFVSFKYAIDDQDIFVTNGLGLDEAVYDLYGRKALEQCFKIDNEYNLVTVSGLVGEPSLLKPNTTSQTIIVNGRYVKDDTISVAVKNAFTGFTMQREYPFFVIEVTLPADMIDVNVHPNKKEVRYANKNDVYRAVYHPIRTHLTNKKILTIPTNQEDANYAPEFEKTKTEQVKIDEVDVPDISAIAKAEKAELENNAATENNDGTARFDNLAQIRAKELNDKLARYDYHDVLDIPIDPKPKYHSSYNLSRTEDGRLVSNDADLPKTIIKYENFFIPPSKLSKKSPEEEAKNPEPLFKTCKTLSYVFEDYILAENEEGTAMLIIDQHAAHERILYDRYLHLLETSTLTMQTSFTPFVYNVTEEHIKLLEMMHDRLYQFGFDYHISEDDKLVVTGVPGHFSNIDMGYFFNSLFHDNEYNFDIEELTKYYVAKKACHAAIKGDMEITLSDVAYLLRTLDNNKDMKCPHGRPVAMAIKKTIFDKVFKRIP